MTVVREELELKARVDDPDEVVRLRVYHSDDRSPEWGVLGWHMGYKICVRVDRAVEQYRLGEATLRLEWYPAMDVLVEVEGTPDAIEQAVAATGVTAP